MKKKKDLIPNFYKIYNKFKSNGAIFPPKEEPNFYKYIAIDDPNNQNLKNKNETEYKEEQDNINNNGINEFEYMENIKNKLNSLEIEKKYKKLVSFLLKMLDNIKIANIYIDNGDIKKLKEPIDIITKGNLSLMDTISSGKLKDEKLLEITLGITEDINQTLAREEQMKEGNRPIKFNSYFVVNENINIKKKKVVLNPKNSPNKNEQNNTNNNNNNKNNINEIMDTISSNLPKVKNELSNISGNIINNNFFNKFDPSKDINLNQIVHYIGPFGQNKNNQNNNNINGNNAMSQDEIDRKQELKELKDLFY